MSGVEFDQVYLSFLMGIDDDEKNPRDSDDDDDDEDDGDDGDDVSLKS